MAEIVVAVYSETGNTRRVAEAIVQEAMERGDSARLVEIDEALKLDLSGCDLLFVGSTCHSADLAAPVRDTLKRLPYQDGPAVAGFVTHSTWTPSDDPAKQALYDQWAGKCKPTFERLCRERGVRFLGFFSCMGTPNPEIEVFIRNTIITDEADWADYSKEVSRHPDQEDLQNARAFARRMIDSLE